MNCIVIDENPASQKLMTEYINQDPHLKLKANCFSAFDGSCIYRYPADALIWN
jgi:hypothetical protein